MIHRSCPPSAAAQLQERISACVDNVQEWMRSNRLQLNTAKTEVLWCASSRRQHEIPQVKVRVGPDYVKPAASVRDLGIYLDSDVLMQTHVSKTVSSCFAVLRQIRSIRRSVTKPVLLSLIVSLVLTRLDYGNATLAGLLNRLLDKLQSVSNAAVRLVSFTWKFDHVTSILRDLHWLRAPQRIDYKLGVLVYCCLHDMAPPYLADTLHRVLVYRCLHDMAPPYLADALHRVSDVESRQRLRSASSAQLLVPSTRHSTIGDRAFPVAGARV